MVLMSSGDLTGGRFGLLVNVYIAAVHQSY